MRLKDKIIFIFQCLIVVWSGLVLGVSAVICGIYVYVYVLDLNMLSLADILTLGLQ